MVHLIRSAALFTLFLFISAAAFGQTGAISGKVTGPDGTGLKDAWIKIDRTDIKGAYKVKTNKKGEYFHAGLPLGTYNVTCEVDGKMADQLKGVRTRLGDPTEVNFDLKQVADRAQALQKAADTGELTKEQERSMSPEEKARIEKQMKERSETMKKNKALNDAFNAGMVAMQGRQWDAAIENFKKGSEMDPKQYAIWANLAESYIGASATKTGAEQATLLDQGTQAYAKAIELKPDDGGAHNNLGLAYAKMKKIKEAEDELNKAAALDPPKAGTYFYNLGAVLTNIGQGDAAAQAFKKAIEADPNQAEAQYQYGLALMGKAQTRPDGKLDAPPGTREAFQKYIELKPNGPNADAAKGMLASLQSSVATTYENPDAAKAAQQKKATTKKK